MTKEKVYLENYSSHTGGYNKGKTAQQDFMRAHIFPIGALKNILVTKLGEESFLLECAFKLKEELKIKTSSNTLEQFKSGFGKSRDSELNPVYDLVPFIVIPKSLEEEINKSVKEYAIKTTQIVGGTGNHHKEGSSKRSAIIVNESDFAEKYPSVYLDIFGYLVERYSKKLENDGDEESALSLRSCYGESLESLHCGTRKIFSLDDKFDVDEERIPLSYSDTEGEAPARKIIIPYQKPSLDEFKKFFEDSLSAKEATKKEKKENSKDELFEKISSIDDKKLKAKIKELGRLCKTLQNSLNIPPIEEEIPTPLSIEEILTLINSLSDNADKNLSNSQKELLKKANSKYDEIYSEADKPAKKDTKENTSHVEKLEKRDKSKANGRG